MSLLLRYIVFFKVLILSSHFIIQVDLIVQVIYVFVDVYVWSIAISLCANIENSVYLFHLLYFEYAS